jgi:hypothetical protein
MSLYQAYSVSSTPSIDVQENSGQIDYPLALHEGCLDDVAVEATWSINDSWVFGGVSHVSTVYFDVVPEKEKQNILL